MFDDLHAYFCENVLPAYRDLEARLAKPSIGRSVDLRFALRACEVLFHLREHLPASSSITRTQVEKRCSDFRLIADIAAASKHRIVTKVTPSGPPLLTSATQIREMLSICFFEDAEGEYRSVSKQVVVELTDGTLVDVMRALTNVLNFWEVYLTEIGVLREPLGHQYDDELGFRPRSMAMVETALEINQGVRVLQNVRLLKFNAESGLAEPMPIPEGAEFEGQIRKVQPHQVDLTLLDEKRGHAFKRTVVLTLQETRALDASSEADRQEVLARFDSIKAGYAALAKDMSSAKSKDAS